MIEKEGGGGDKSRGMQTYRKIPRPMRTKQNGSWSLFLS